MNDNKQNKDQHQRGRSWGGCGRRRGRGGGHGYGHRRGRGRGRWQQQQQNPFNQHNPFVQNTPQKQFQRSPQINSRYFWTHGMCGHTSNTYNSLAQGHCWEATVDKKMNENTQSYSP